MFVRVEVAVKAEFTDPGAGMFLRRVELAHPSVRRRIRWARLIDVYWLDVEVAREKVVGAISEIFHDPVLKWLFTGDLIPSAAGKWGGIQDLMAAAPERPGVFWALEKKFRPGVTDNVGRTTQEAFEIVLGEKLPQMRAASGKLLLLEGPEIHPEDLELIARDVFANELIESWMLLTQDEISKNSRFSADQVKRQLPKAGPSHYRLSGRSGPGGAIGVTDGLETVRLQELSESQLVQMSRERLWALSLEEMKAIQKHFLEVGASETRKSRGLSEFPTDVEMEVLAQTWSEHCKHKIFNAHIQYKNASGEPEPQTLIPDQIESLFQETIVGTTRRLPRSWLLSVFDDNAGIVALDEEHAVCIKVETHNTPSALDPYGGALTGIVGVNRDILGCGLGAKPIFNTDVFCVARPDFEQSLPERILHPRRVLDGVRLGVEHGGNKSGIPTVNGALVFDHRYLGKPLIYCGTGGILPRVISGKPCELKEIRVGDRICMVGGRIGKDGIHGATFSSLALDENSPSSAVQLGDPITQKRVVDFLLEARDQGLYRTLTDNGAGGLSSSVGELARISNGARMDVALARTKYPGLRPYELVVSESQERMTVAVPPQFLEKFQELADRRGVEVSVLGEFLDTGFFEIQYQEKTVALLNLQFLHKGVPQLRLEAVWNGRPERPGTFVLDFGDEGKSKLLALLSRPNIASKEWLIRQYDHEVQGSSVIKPLHTVQPGSSEEWSGPNDASVIKPKSGSWSGLAVGCGINPKLSDIDPYLMGQSVVDEAIRNVLCVGAEYGRADTLLALVDNFCWPDPTRHAGYSAALVRACYGMREAALTLEAPFVSGKDSMKNDYKGRRDGKEYTLSVPPTLLITAIAKVPDIRHCRTSDFKTPGDQIYLIGGKNWGLLGSELHAWYRDTLRDKGGSEDRVVLPSYRVEIAEKGRRAVAGVTQAPRPNWGMARRIYQWLGGAEGAKQGLLRSVHDVSEGGLLVAIAESLIARGLGAEIQLPSGADLWEFAFGEGFHSFVVSVAEASTPDVEAEWNDLGVPYLRLGTVTYGGVFEVRWSEGWQEQEGQASRRSWKVPVPELRAAWGKPGYWE